ncbi:tyrosine-protein phosphatase [Acidocella sp. KAb 2-4]|uniref:tyrosine-protein phosphatase n=1 Tax=Acidocella sp. KAb 2-4 TaxID=2885158 RepID=UPI001D06943E|nr:tyrosine-protein phosphatase [Acidocella sp. KAb 2-4]MCB5945564.1 tyrosine-protein phosphatase [Acidocella sp. KAb 2-4]
MTSTMPGTEARFVRLAGAHNVRDIGGYATRDGRKVATGLVYRAGSLARLTDEDLRVVTELGIRVVCDFRTNGERAHRPSRLPAEVELWARDHDIAPGNLLQAMSGAEASAEKSREMMLDLYREMAFQHAESFAELFRRIADGLLPLLFHCTAGKDRTGTATALLLDWIGVTRAEIAEDYALTDLFLEQGLMAVMRDYGTDLLPPDEIEKWKPLMRADTAYIETMFAAVEAAHGSVGGYLREALKLDEQTLARVRERLLA